MLVCSALVDFTRSAHTKGQFISKENCQTVNFSKQRTNKFVFTSMRRVFVCFLEEIEDFKMAFRKYLTFTTNQMKALGRAPHSTEAKVKAPH